MAIYRVQAPDGSVLRFEGPDDATPQQVEAAASQHFGPKSQDKPYSATEGINSMQLALEGVGKGFVDLARGAGQRLGLVSPQDVAETRKYDAPLMRTTEGKAGNIAGNFAAMVPAAFVPGANTVAGAAAIGGLAGALQPTTRDESALKNAAMGAMLGGGSQLAIGKVAQLGRQYLSGAEAQGAQLASQNAPRDATLRAAQDAGYVVPPSQAEAGLPSRILEGLSGKYKTNQLATIKNQSVTDALARKAVGLAADEPITREALQGVRNAAYQAGYEPVVNAGAMPTSKAYNAALDTIKSTYQGAANSFPGAVKNDVSNLVESLKVPQFDAGDAIKMTQVLRDQAGAAFAQGDRAMGKAARDAAKVIEDEIERNLAAKGKDGAALLKGFRDARQLMAKSHSVEQALVAEGGKINAKVLGAALQKGKPLSDELKTVGAFANNYGDVVGVAKSGFANPFTIMDFGFGSATGSPVLPMARVAARYGILSKPFQQAAVRPNYGPGLLTKSGVLSIEELRRLGAGGLLSAVVNAPQQ